MPLSWRNTEAVTRITMLIKSSFETEMVRSLYPSRVIFYGIFFRCLAGGRRGVRGGLAVLWSCAQELPPRDILNCVAVESTLSSDLSRRNTTGMVEPVAEMFSGLIFNQLHVLFDHFNLEHLHTRSVYLITCCLVKYFAGCLYISSPTSTTSSPLHHLLQATFSSSSCPNGL